MYKNTLQEFCQKRKLELPIYETIYLGGPSHDPKFISKVTINYHNEKYTKTSQPSSSKKEAEKLVAKKMVGLIKRLEDEKIKYYEGNNIYIFVDLENVHMGDFFQHRKFSPGIKFIGFATKNHPSINVAPKELTKIKTINSGEKDAGDILIIAYTAKLGINLDKNITHDIIILTKDHFGQGLVDYIKDNHQNINPHHIKTTEDLGNFFDKF